MLKKKKFNHIEGVGLSVIAEIYDQIGAVCE